MRAQFLNIGYNIRMAHWLDLHCRLSLLFPFRPPFLAAAQRAGNAGSTQEGRVNTSGMANGPPGAHNATVVLTLRANGVGVH